MLARTITNSWAKTALARFAAKSCLVIGLVTLFGSPGLAASSAQTVRRVALVVGNAGYTHVSPLENPVGDAKAMAKLLSDAGFTTVEIKTDLDGRAFRRVLADFELLARGADVAIVFYSGHGIEFGGQNYLVPVDAAIDRDVDVKDETIPLDRVLEAVSGATRLKLVLLDACRTDPFKATSLLKAVSRGLQSIEPSEANELVAYAAKAGTVAAEGAPGEHSPYTAALLKRLTTPGLDVELALRRVHDDVLAATHHDQEPFYYGAMGGDEVSLATGVADPPKPPAAAAETKAPRPAASDPAAAACDRLAASPYDAARPAGLAGVYWREIDVRRAIPTCRDAVRTRPNDPRLEFELGRTLDHGAGSPSEVLDLFRKSANAGYAGAMDGLGEMYRDGRGVAKDAREALRWYRKGADAGSASAMESMAKMYELGISVPRDGVAAERWYRRAAAAGRH